MTSFKENISDDCNYSSPFRGLGGQSFRWLGVLLFLIISISLSAAKLPWENGKLVVSENHRYLQHENGTPFFWLGDTGWLFPERLNRDEAEFYLNECSKNGYNLVQIQVIDKVPSINFYGQSSMPDGFNFKDINKKGVYGYWNHLDYIIKMAEKKGIYIGMTCIWGSLVNAGHLSVADAQTYGKFLAERYKNSPNIIWFIGGDIRGDIKTEVWEALATSIKAVDKNHLMTYHPRGRTCSSTWFNSAQWLDFNMFQSGHRRYGQRKGDGDYTIAENTEEDNWHYAEKSLSLTPLKPVIDGEPSYEDIPQGLHEEFEVRWTANDVRRYAYWSVFAGSFGHTYGHNSIMQFYKPGVNGSFFPTRYWYDCLKDQGYTQMKYLKVLMLAFPYFERVPDQSIIAGQNGERYDRAIATRGDDYLLVYNYTGRPMLIDLSKISGEKKNCWWYNPKNCELQFIGEFECLKITNFVLDVAYNSGNDRVLIAVDKERCRLNPQKGDLSNLYSR